MQNTSQFAETIIKIAKRALRILGVLEQGDDIAPEKMSEALEALNAVVQVQARKGTKLWLNRAQKSLATTATAITLAQDVIGVVCVFLRRQSMDFPITLIDKTLYTDLLLKNIPGQPSRIWLDRSVQPLVMYLQPIPNQPYDIYWTELVRFGTYTSQLDDSGFPAHWLEALPYMLAATLAPEYTKTIQERQDLRAEAQAKRKDAEFIDRGQSDDNTIRSIY